MLSPAPLDIIAEEAHAHRFGINTQSGARALLLGYLIGRQWQESGLSDEERLRAWLRRYFGATGRRRRER